VAAHAAVALVLLWLGSNDAEAQDTREWVEVVELDIIGARDVDESALRALLETRSPPRLPWRDRADFDPVVFEADLKRIEAFYADRGYPHTRAHTGFDILPTGQLEAIRANAPLQQGRPLARTDVQEAVRQAITALWNAGYAHARVDALETMVAPDRVRIEIRAGPGVQAVFGRIDIAGNITIPDGVIRRQLTYLPGQLFQVMPLEESRRRLERLGLFESVEITVVEPESPAVVTLVVVKERDHTQFTYSFGHLWEKAWTLSSRLHADGGLGARYRSPFGLLRFDVAWQFTIVEGLRIDGEPQTRRWRMHAGVGHCVLTPFDIGIIRRD
jgi:outer membrane protein assembly factor BamA